MSLIHDRIVNNIQTSFQTLFQSAPALLVCSPGRVNIIGEHTDYNEGFVLPAAIDKAAYVGISKRADDEVHLYAVDFKQHFQSTLSTLQPSDKEWPNYVIGVVDQLQKAGYTIGGFNLVLDGDVPIGAGLSSSAAVECASVFALNELYNLGIEKMDLVKMAQKAEHTFAGVKVGIMDMFASMFGKQNHVIKLDCRSLEFEYVPFKLEGIKVVLFNTNVKHSLASTAYNKRREECEQGVAWIKEHHSQINSLRDVSVAMLDEYVAPKDAIVYKRCRFVVEEIQRLLQGCEDLERGDIEALGQKMFRTHDGLSKEYEVSCKELDFLVHFVRDNPAVLGSRMMGGGFGGCTINLIKEAAVEGLTAQISKAYAQNMNLDLTAYTVQIEQGTHQEVLL